MVMSGLDIECLDRIYLNGYVPKLQVGGQVVGFMTRHLGYRIPSPAIMEKIGTRFRRAVHAFAATNQVPIVRFAKADRKKDVMRAHLARQAETGRVRGGRDRGRAGVPERVRLLRARGPRRHRTPGVVHLPQGRPAGDLLLLLPVGRRLRAGVHQGLRLLPVPGQGVGQRPRVGQTASHHAGIGFTELSNGFATCTDPAGLQAICDRLGPGTIEVFFDRWMSRLPLPLTDADRDAGYWWELSMRQVETSRTLVFDAPRHARRSSKRWWSTTSTSAGPTTSS